MRLWTIQGIAIYEQMVNEGIAFCTTPSWSDDDYFMYAYHWMAEQMRKRIGEPPVDDIKYPIWAWYQYNSAKSKKPTRSTSIIPEGISAYMEIEVPDKDVLLSCFDCWHAVLNLCPLCNWKSITKKTDALDKEAGRRLEFKEYPVEIQKEIETSWEAVFDLDRRDADTIRTHKRNRCIQATFWALKPEYVISVEFLERKDNIIKQISYIKH
jgi:hypothetical protein